jgi:uncharacterized protein with FMN-binding domain
MTTSKKIQKNKVLVSLGLGIASVIYVLSQYVGGVSAAGAPAATAAVSSSQTHTVSAVATTQTASTPAGQYTDGTYTGSAANAYYGTVQVQAVIQNGKITNVQFLQYANDRSTSVAINDRAIPILQSEAIASQSANVNIVSGATFTSQAFEQSLGSALQQAQG